MKHLLIFALTVFCFTAMSAHNSNMFDVKSAIILKDVRNFNFELSEEKLSNTLHIDRFKTYDIIDIHNEFCKRMTEASLVVGKEKQYELICKAIDYELLHVKDVLAPQQYQIFLKWFNQSLKDRGFENILVQKNKNQIFS